MCWWPLALLLWTSQKLTALAVGHFLAMTVVIDLVSFYKTVTPISVMGCDHLKPKTAWSNSKNYQIFQDWGYCLVSNKARRDSTSVILFQTMRWVRRDCQTEIDRQHRLLFSMPPVPVMMTLQHKVPVSSKISFQNVPDINVTISFCSFWLFKPSSQLFEPWQVQSLLDVWNGKICLIMLVLF